LLVYGNLDAQTTLDFSASEEVACAPAVIQFKSDAAQVVAWKWRLGTQTSTQQKPSALFAEPGVYDIQLVVKYADGRQDSLSKPAFIRIYQKPTAAFELETDQACLHQPVSFTDMSSPGDGQIVRWEWDFGNGFTDSVQHPVHTYSQRGSFPVSLVVKNEYGCQDEARVADAITIQAPQVEFEAENIISCGPPLETHFSSGQPGQHFWDFGDGQTASEPDPTHVYTQNGSFTVTHVITDSQSCTDTLRKTHLVNIGVNTLGIAALDSSICITEPARFTALTSPQSQVSWNFGDSTFSNQLNPVHQYQHPGIYEVSAHIADPSGCQTQASLSIEVYPRPVVNFSARDTTVACELPYTLRLQDESQHVSRWLWHFGDGSQSPEPHPSHTYLEEGRFDVRLEVENAGGCRAVLERTDWVIIEQTEARMWANRRAGCAPLSVQFRDTSKSVYPITEWLWDFGDGMQATGPNPAHTYQQPGSYTVSLVVTNSRGCRDTLVQPAMVVAGTKPQVDFRADTTKTCALSNVLFTNLSSQADAYIWAFGDGDTAMSEHAVHAFGALGHMDVMLIAFNNGCADTLIRPAYIEVLAPLPIVAISNKRICDLPAKVQVYNFSLDYDFASWNTAPPGQSQAFFYEQVFTEEGSYPVSLTIGNNSTGCTLTTIDSIRIQTVEARFEALPEEGCLPLEVEFEDQSVNAKKWWWEFGQGDTSSRQHPAVRYEHAGTYDVQLVVENALECRDTLRKTGYIRVSPTLADFEVDGPAAGCLPLGVSFTDKSQSGSRINSWLWDFGDGHTSTSQHPFHQYDSAGTFTVTLTITDEYGCTSSKVVDEAVLVTRPVADFLVNYPTNCPGNEIVFLSQSQGVALRYHWDFGDGHTDSLANPVHTYEQAGTYDLSLLVTDINGCTSLVSREQHIHIAPLNANFTADTTYSSCPPLRVQFFPDSQYVHPGLSWQWQFGDGASAQQPQPAHHYTAAGTYDVQLVVAAPSGCTDTLLRPAYITLDGPGGSFEFEPEKACPGAAIYFRSHTFGAVQQQWIFGDGAAAFGDSAAHIYEQPGLYEPALLLEDSLGCKVVIQSSQNLRIYEQPVAAFALAQRTICPQVPLQFTDSSSSAIPIVEWWWEFGDGHTSKVQHPLHSYAQPGSYDVRLRVLNQKGCTDEVYKSQWVEVLEDTLPSPVSIQFVSVEGNHRIRISHEAYPAQAGDFGSYRLYRRQGNGSWVPIDSSTNRQHTLWVDEGVEARDFAYCYKVQVVNHCGRAHPLQAAGAHCSIELSATPGEDSIHLGWTPYQGWEPEVWQIFRVSGYSPQQATLIGSVPGFVHTFTDADMNCYDGHSYRVQAVGPDYHSWSDTAAAAPIHYGPAEPMHLLTATVADNQWIQLEWELPQIERLAAIRLERQEGSRYKEIYREEVPVQNLKYRDEAVSVQQAFYRYRALGIDSCGDLTPIGQTANSILLRAEVQADHVQLSWNPYEGWTNGVDYYEIQKFDVYDGKYKIISTLSSSGHTYSEPMTDDPKEKHCYRVLAYEQGGHEMSSLSNEVCVQPVPLIFVPNAFSPNGDGNNDFFEIKGLFLKNVRIHIYNRWGNRVFEAQNLTSAWDGKLPDGQVAPEGVYVFVISGTSFEDKAVNKVGSLTLFR